MFSTEFSTICAISLGILTIWSVLLTVYVIRASAISRAAIRFVSEEYGKTLKRSEIADLELAVTELTDSYDSVFTSIKKLRARMNARNRRENPPDDDQHELDFGAAPSNESERAVYKSGLRIKAKKEGLI